MGGPELVDGPNDGYGSTVTDESADDQHKPHVCLQCTQYTVMYVVVQKLPQ